MNELKFYQMKGEVEVNGRIIHYSREPIKKEKKMSELKFYRTANSPTIILGKDWAEEPEAIDQLLRQECGAEAKWSRMFAFGEVANNIYYLFKRGYRKFILDHIHFRHDYGNVYTVVLDTNVVFEEGDIQVI